MESKQTIQDIRTADSILAMSKFRENYFRYPKCIRKNLVEMGIQYTHFFSNLLFIMKETPAKEESFRYKTVEQMFETINASTPVERVQSMEDVALIFLKAEDDFLAAYGRAVVMAAGVDKVFMEYVLPMSYISKKSIPQTIEELRENSENVFGIVSKEMTQMYEAAGKDMEKLRDMIVDKVFSNKEPDMVEGAEKVAEAISGEKKDDVPAQAAATSGNPELDMYLQKYPEAIARMRAGDVIDRIYKDTGVSPYMMHKIMDVDPESRKAQENRKKMEAEERQRKAEAKAQAKAEADAKKEAGTKSADQMFLDAHARDIELLKKGMAYTDITNQTGSSYYILNKILKLVPECKEIHDNAMKEFRKDLCAGMNETHKAKKEQSQEETIKSMVNQENEMNREIEAAREGKGSLVQMNIFGEEEQPTPTKRKPGRPRKQIITPASMLTPLVPLSEVEGERKHAGRPPKEMSKAMVKKTRKNTVLTGAPIIAANKLK